MDHADWKERVAELRVLVVDDEPQIVELIQYVLGEVGIGRVHTAGDGQAAWRRFRDGALEYDVVICEWMIPKMDGLDLLQHIRDQGSDVPFIMLSVQVTRDLVAAAKQFGVTAFVAKPFTAGDLKRKVETIAAKVIDARDNA
jgi:CheY-like chemotaxis protein